MPKKKAARRRIKGEGAFIQRSNGTWEFRINLGYDASGKLMRKSFYGQRQEDAKEKYNEYLEQKRAGTAICKKMPLSSWADEWLQTYKKDTVSQKTYENYEYMLKHIKESDIGKIPLDEIKPIHIRKFLQKRANTSHSQITKLKALLYGMFETAIENDLCIKNPARNVDPPMIKQEEKESFTDAEISVIREFASTEKGKHFELAINTLLYTGIRRGELLALMWDDIDFDNSILRVRRGLTFDENDELTTTGSNSRKNHDRDIPLPNHLVNLFRTAKENQKELQKSDNDNKKAKGLSLYIFTTKYGTLMLPNSFRKPYDTFFKNLNVWCDENDKAHVRCLTTHECRHTYASMLLRGGVDSRIIQSLMGHSEVETTDGYMHTDIELLRRAVKKIG